MHFMCTKKLKQSKKSIKSINARSKFRIHSIFSQKEFLKRTDCSYCFRLLMRAWYIVFYSAHSIASASSCLQAFYPGLDKRMSSPRGDGRGHVVRIQPVVASVSDLSCTIGLEGLGFTGLKSFS